MSTAKEDLTRLIQQQPEDSSREEIIRELAFHAMVDRGLADADLAKDYRSQVDPRLNYGQALELAMRIATVARSA